MTNVTELKAKEVQSLETYRGFEIFLTQDFKFKIYDPANPDDKDVNAVYASPSMSEAKGKIDEVLAKREKTNRTTWKKFRVLTAEGKEIEVRGVNKNTGYVLTTPAGLEPRDLYPAGFPFLVEKLKEWELAEARAQELRKYLYKFRVDGNPGYRNADIEHLIRYYDNFEKELTKATELATQEAERLAKTAE